jgi:RNA polymerase sigma-70 factor, ECF subfamily
MTAKPIGEDSSDWLDSEEEYGARMTPPPPTPTPSVLNSLELSASNLKHARRVEAEEDRELIRLAQSGDREAFRKLVERHQRKAFSIAVSIVRDEQDAKEMVQEAFLRVHRNLHTFEGSSSFFTWLYRIITNLGIDFIRRPGRQLAELVPETVADEAYGETDFPLLSKVDGSDPNESIRRGEIGDRLRAALEALPPYHRVTILLREVEGMSYEEIAESTQVSKGTVMSRLFHARQKLQKALSDCYAEQIGVPHQGLEAKPEGDEP